MTARAVRSRRFLHQCFWVSLTVVLVATSSLRADFLRGDVDQDGRISVGDAVATILYLFDARTAPTCEDAADSNDDGIIDLTDPLFVLRGLFSSPSDGISPFLFGPDLTCDELGCASAPSGSAAIVINEIQYNPNGVNLFPPPGENAEFVELFNRSNLAADLSEYSFTEGIRFTFPSGQTLGPGEFLVLAKDPEDRFWRGHDLPRVGPYEGTLANGGERLTLVQGDCVVETLRYDDRPPWPIGADGYGRSLERVATEVPGEDFHAWRTSIINGGTPGEPNSTAGTPARPLISGVSITPRRPTSSEPVTVRVQLDVGREEVRSVTIRWTAWRAEESLLSTAAMHEVGAQVGMTEYEAVLPPQPNESMVRFNLDVETAAGVSVLLPPPSDQHPLLSYFVYDGTVTTNLRAIWLFGPDSSMLLPNSERDYSGAVIQAPGSPPENFDGALVRRSGNGKKVTFLKGAEYQGNRTINIILESTTEAEFLGFSLYHAAQALAPWVDWFRVIDRSARRDQNFPRLVIEQVNESFLRRSGLDDDGDLYKLDKGSFSKKTNFETRNSSLNELLDGLRSSDPAVVRQTVLSRLDLDDVALVSAIGVFMSNWDGFDNNQFLYWDLDPISRWRLIPWDLDGGFGCADFPLSYPLDAVPGTGCESRPLGPIIFPFHTQPDLHAGYVDLLGRLIAADGPLHVSRLLAIVDDAATALREDVLLIPEAELRGPRDIILSGFEQSFDALRRFLPARAAFLEDATAR